MRFIVFSFLFLTCCHVALADAAAGKVLYDQRCASCHGATGAGDGPVALALPEANRPANLKTGARKFATDSAKFSELLKKGGSAVGLNALMPPQPDLKDEQIQSLEAYVNSLKS